MEGEPAPKDGAGITTYPGMDQFSTEQAAVVLGWINKQGIEIIEENTDLHTDEGSEHRDWRNGLFAQEENRPVLDLGIMILNMMGESLSGKQLVDLYKTSEGKLENVPQAVLEALGRVREKVENTLREMYIEREIKTILLTPWTGGGEKEDDDDRYYLYKVTVDTGENGINSSATLRGSVGIFEGVFIITPGEVESESRVG